MERVLGSLGLLVIALTAASAAGIIVGARTLADLSPALSPAAAAAVGGIAGLLVAFVLPLYVASRILGRTGARIHRPSVTLGTVIACNAAILALTMALMGASTADALRSHGTWFLAGQPAPAVQSAIVWVADHIHAPAATEPAPPEPGSPTPEPSPAPVDEGPWDAKRVFAERSPSIFVVRTWSPVEDDMMRMMMRAFGMERAEGQGSAFAVAPDRIVTNYHVIGTAEQAEIVLPDETTLAPIEVLALDATNDLALLRVPGASFVPIPLSEAELAVGEPCFAIGAPLGMEQTLTEGIVSARREMNGTRVVQMQTPIAPGSSGSPLLDAKGELIGVNTATFGLGMNVAIDLTHVRALLASAGPAPVKQLQPPPVRMVLADLKVEGELLPTERERIGQLGAIIAGAGEGCTQTLTTDARIEMSVKSRALALDQTTLPPDADKCLRDRMSEAKTLGFLLSAALGNKVHALELTYERRGVLQASAPPPSGPQAGIPLPALPSPDTRPAEPTAEVHPLPAHAPPPAATLRPLPSPEVAASNTAATTPLRMVVRLVFD